MDTKEMTSLLEHAGLSEKAALIYSALLGRRKMTLSELAKSSGTKRTTCYQHVDALLSRDFVVRIPVGKRMYYAAESPRKILSSLKERSERFERNLPVMVDIYEQTIQRPKVTFYEGKRELRRIYDDLFKTIGDVRSIFPPSAFFDSFSLEEYDEFDKSLTDHALRSLDLFVDDKHVRRIREIRKKNGAAGKSDKRLPPWFTSNVDVLIYSEKVALISLRDLSAIVVENSDIAELFRRMHDALWRLSK